jgi:hypothetical protein
MKRSLFLLATVLAVALTVFSGVLQGRMRNRWGPPADTLAVAAKLEQLPAQFGPWRLKAQGKLDETAKSQLEPFAYRVATYENQTTGEWVSMTLLLGPPGPTAVHTPEICLGSRDYKSLGERQAAVFRRADGTNDQLWTLDHKANNLQGMIRRTYYGWSAGNRWTATEDPRFTFASQPYLYKIQAICDLSAAADPQSADPCRRFLEDFLPAARKYLVEPSKN